MQVKSLDQLDVQGKRVLVRVDYNVPLSNGTVADDFRIKASLPTISALLEKGASLVLMSHLGRPEGTGYQAELSMAPVAARLQELLGREVSLLGPTSPDGGGIVSDAVTAACHALQPGQVALLENLRFQKEEKKGDEAFGRALANLADAYVSDAFGTAHRKDASMTQPPRHLPSAAGRLMMAEIEYLGGIVTGPAKPFVAILGGAKVGDKLPILETLAPKCDALCIGGAMAYTFLAARGTAIGASRFEPDLVETATGILDRCAADGVAVVLPSDHVIAAGIDSTSGTVAEAIPEDRAGFDIGPATISEIAGRIRSAKTVLFNGPVGVFEREPFRAGTKAVVEAIAEATAAGATTVVGGGDAAAAVKEFGVADRITHVSTGGGASLELLGGNTLPGIVALESAAARMDG